MLKEGVIQPSQSNWAAPVLLVRKKMAGGGSALFCNFPPGGPPGAKFDAVRSPGPVLDVWPTRATHRQAGKLDTQDAAIPTFCCQVLARTGQQQQQ